MKADIIVGLQEGRTDVLTATVSWVGGSTAGKASSICWQDCLGLRFKVNECRLSSRLLSWTDCGTILAFLTRGECDETQGIDSGHDPA